MELRQLTTFRTVAQTLSFSRAAHALNYVQSSVTTQIQNLEEELGVHLFDRLGKRIALTDAGKRFLTYAEKILELTEEARDAVRTEEEPGGSVIISTPESLCTYRLHTALLRFREMYPRARLIFRPNSCENARRCVSEGELDLAVTLDAPLRSTTLIVELLTREPLLLLISPEHPLAHLEMVRTEDLQNERFLMTEQSCSYRVMLDRILREAGIDALSDLEFSSVEAIKQCAMIGMGVAFLPLYTVRAELAQKKLVVLSWEGRQFEVFTQIFWHKEKWLSPTVRAFIDIVREELRQEEAPTSVTGASSGVHV